MQKLPKWHLQTWALQCPWPPAQDPRSVSLLSSSPNNSCFCASKQTMTLVLLLQSRNHSSASSFWLLPSVSKVMLRPADRTPHTHPCPSPLLQCLSSSLPIIIILAQSDPGSSGHADTNLMGLLLSVFQSQSAFSNINVPEWLYYWTKAPFHLLSNLIFSNWEHNTHSPPVPVSGVQGR